MIRVLLATLASLAIASGSAVAQSRKYPPVPPDKDREAEGYSSLWEAALNPELRPYNDLVRAAEQHLARSSPSETKQAIEKLDAAIAKLPKEPRAYALRGRIHLMLRDWARCADDLGALEDFSRETDASARARSRIDLGVCQARAGRYADAERTLVRAAATAPGHRGEIGVRLGEIRIALGKLEEAIDALTGALDANDIKHQLTRWLLVSAYDRARRPTEAIEHAQIARRLDPHRIYIESPNLPHLGVAEQLYMLGTAYRYALPQPEYALLFFREFVKRAPESPWRRRAEEHVRELGNLRFPAADTVTTTGPASTKPEQMRAALARPMTAIRACLTKMPTTAFQVTITRVGPKSPPAPDRPMYRLPTPSIRVAALVTVGERGTDADASAAAKCIEREAAKAKMPVPREKDTWYMMSFLVVSP